MDGKVKIGLGLTIGLQIVIICLLYFYMQTRPMLNARAYNQEANLIANWQNFTPEAKQRILRDWETAEYSADGKRYLLSITPGAGAEQK